MYTQHTVFYHAEIMLKLCELFIYTMSLKYKFFYHNVGF
jgi:hypothetical protein